MGLDLTTGRGGFGGGDINQRAQSMFGRYQGIWGEVVAKTKDVKGYPVKTSFAFAFGGPQCKSAQSQQQADSGGDSTPTTPGGLAGAMAGKLGSMFHKKQDDAPAAADPAAPVLPDGLIALITMTSELVSVSTAGVSADLFEVPADFKKTALRGQ